MATTSNIIESLAPKTPSRLNKYALSCAILASTNSILLGYGMYYKILIPFKLYCLNHISTFIISHSLMH